jgi:phage gpG-like protein
MSNDAANGALQVLIRDIDGLRTTQFRSDMSAATGAAAHKKLIDGFVKQQDPYGNPWPPLRIRRGQALRDTARMQNSFSSQPTPRGFSLASSVQYVRTHQRGAVIVPRAGTTLKFRAGGRFYTLRRAVIPKRQMVPEANTGGVGPIWGEAINREADAVMRAHMGQR